MKKADQQSRSGWGGKRKGAGAVNDGITTRDMLRGVMRAPTSGINQHSGIDIVI